MNIAARQRRLEQASTEILRALVSIPGAIRSSIHPLRGGHSVRKFIDLDLLLADPHDCRNLVERFAATIQDIALESPDPIDFLGFIEKASGGTVGAIRLAAAISIATKIPNIILRPAKDLHVERIKLSPASSPMPLKNARIILVTDHSSTGEEMLSAAEIVSSFGAKTVAVVTVTHRPDLLQRERFSEHGIEFVSIVPAWDCLAVLAEKATV